VWIVLLLALEVVIYLFAYWAIIIIIAAFIARTEVFATDYTKITLPFLTVTVSCMPYDVCRYIPKYTFSWLVKPMWFIIKFLHRAADLTLVMSHALGKEMKAAGASTGTCS
jgi:hypothetical protein